MAAPKKYKTNTLKTSSAKKSSARTTAKKRPTSRVGSTKLAKKSFFKAWMALPIIAAVALAGYAIVQLSQASSGYSFFASGGNIRGGQHTRYDTGAGGSQAVTVIKNGQSIYANASKSQLNASRQVCVGFFRPKTGGSADVSISVDGTYSNSYRFVQGNALQPVCSKPLSTGFKNSHRVVVKTIGQASLPVQAIYGTLRPPDPKCGKVVRLGAKWVVTNGGKTLAEYRRDLVYGCDSRGIHTSDGWRAWKKTGATRPNPNYRPPVSCGSNDVKRGSFCVPKYVYAKQIGCMRGYRKLTKPYGNRNKYTCVDIVSGRSITKPVSITCFDSGNYQAYALDRNYFYCARRANR